MMQGYSGGMIVTDSNNELSAALCYRVTAFCAKLNLLNEHLPLKPNVPVLLE